MGKEAKHDIGIHGNLRLGVDVEGGEREVEWERGSTDHKENCKSSNEDYCSNALFSKMKSKKKDK